MIEGEKLGTFWGYTFDGIWQEDEVNAPFIDANGYASFLIKSKPILWTCLLYTSTEPFRALRNVQPMSYP